MSLIVLETEIFSDIETCFDTARSIDFHKESLKHTNEIPISGKTTGLIELGEWVSWEAKHLGFVQHLTSKVTAFERPYYFVDKMVLGAFKSYRHEHFFKAEGAKTIMLDKFYFESPCGVLGEFVNWVYLKKYMTDLLKTRNRLLKKEAEAAAKLLEPVL